MKALTIRQPWASLIALGVKHIETRSWSTRYRGPLAIHAGKAWPVPVAEWQVPHDRGLGPMVERMAMVERMVDPADPVTRRWETLHTPRGAVVAVADLIDVVPMVAWAPLDGPATWAARLTLPDGTVEGVLLRDHGDGVESIHRHGPLPADIDVTDQLPYGDFTPGRYAWLLDNIRPIDPVPAKGRQGLWEWEANDA